MSFSSEILSRLLIYLNLESFSELATLLGVSPSALSQWKKNNSFDLIRIIPLCPDINWHWLITGEGEMRYNPKEKQEKQAMIEYLLRKVKELESENEILKKLYQEAIKEKEALKQLIEEQTSEEKVKVPKITLPDENEVFKQDLTKSGGLFPKEKRKKPEK